MDYDKEIKDLEVMLEQYKQAYVKCAGALEYLKNKKEETKDLKEEKNKKKE